MTNPASSCTFDTMPIDDCPHSFQELAQRVLPDHLRRLEAAMPASVRLGDFAATRTPPPKLVPNVVDLRDFSGCYVLIDQRPIYVGISRHVPKRLKQHVAGRTHFDASLAYRMAKEVMPHEMTRGGAMSDAAFRKHFEERREYLKEIRVAAIQIDDPLELYLFEAYAALHFDTAKWNTFRTH